MDDLDDQMSFVTKRRKRASFLPMVVSTPMHHYMDSLESIDSAMVDAQVREIMHGREGSAYNMSRRGQRHE